MRATLAFFLALSIVVSPLLARAEAPAPDALELGHQALERFQAGDFEPALEGFRHAQALAYSPVFALYAARCERGLGRLIDARKSYQDVAGAALPGNAPEPWRVAQQQARLELGELSSRIPSVVVAAHFQVTRFDLDGKALTPAELGQELELDPGKHRIVLSGPSGVATQEFEAGEGERRRRVTLDLPPPAPKQEPVATPKRPQPDPAATGRHLSGPSRPVWIPLALGGVALTIGVTAGIVAINKLNEVEKNCVGDRCPPENEADMAPVRRWAAISTTAFAVGAAGVTVGVVLHLREKDPERQAFGLRVSGNL